MDFGFVLGSAFGGAFAMTLIMFTLCAVAIQSQRKAKLGWQKTLFLFAVSLTIMTAINLALFISTPSLLTDNEDSALSIIQTFILPLIVCAGTLLLLWKPKGPSSEN